jgi:hypothetical protein
VIENSAHDSICGCSADEVSAQGARALRGGRAAGPDLAAEALEPARAATPRGAASSPTRRRSRADDVVVLDLRVPAEWDDVSARERRRLALRRAGALAERARSCTARSCSGATFPSS